MRILANYSYKSGDSNYCVTFETMGDVPRGQADLEVDDLFALAKEAIQRQLNAQPKLGNCNCNALITPRQKHLIIKLARERGEFIDLQGMTLHQASDLIERFLTSAV